MVKVRKKKNIQTPTCRPSVGLSDLQLNKSEESSSVASSKTLSNSSKESRKSSPRLADRTSHNGNYSPKRSASQEDVVFVLSKNDKPLMPTKSGKARRMLKSGIAKCVSRTPFTIKMLVDTCEYKQKLDAGMDTGSKNIGVAVRLSSTPVYLSEVRLRSDEIRRKMEQRAMFRRTRRGRKTPYRQARFLNRGKAGKLAPSIKHIIDAHLREKQFVENMMPKSYITWHVETANFDIHKITNPKVSDYQKGSKYGFENVKSYILSRDQYTCQKCKASEVKLEVHHIIFKSNGGTNSPNNLVALCSECHSGIHAHKNAVIESLKLQKKSQARTKDATKVSVVKSQLHKKFGEFKETFGYETKLKRQILGFPKSHRLDALLASCEIGEVVDFPTCQYFERRLVSQGDYQQTSGSRSEKKIPTGKLFGFRKFDLIKTDKGVGFVKGKRSSGYFAVSNIRGESISDSVNVKKTAKRLAARKTVLAFNNIEERFLPALKNRVSALGDR